MHSWAVLRVPLCCQAESSGVEKGSMSESLVTEFKQHRRLSPEGERFLVQLEPNIAQDLWKSAGGNWSRESVKHFRQVGMEKLASFSKGETFEDFQKAWIEVVRDFHKDCWGEKRLQKKEKKVQTESDKIFWELFSYIWALLQTVFITKTAVFYFGIKSAQEDTTEGKVYVVLAILFSFVSLAWFAIRKSRKKKGS